MTLTYLGSTRVLTNYNVMGVAKAGLEAAVRYLASELGEKKIRVNANFGGPRKKPRSARGIKDFSKILELVQTKAHCEGIPTLRKLRIWRYPGQQFRPRRNRRRVIRRLRFSHYGVVRDNAADERG